MRKPNSCQGCPFFQHGLGFIPPEPSACGSPILVVGEHPSSDDVRGIHYTGYDDKGSAITESGRPGPFRGFRGHKLKQLGYEGIHKDHVIRCQPPRGYTNGALRQATLHCAKAHQVIPEGVELIIAHGDIAWDAYLDQYDEYYTNKQDRDDRFHALWEWRGFLEPHHRVTDIPVYGVQDLQSTAFDKVARYTAKIDWAKIPSILDKSWPIPEPKEVINVTRVTTTESIDEFFSRYLSHTITPLVIDTEYTIKDRFLRLFGCGYHTTTGREYYLQLYWSNSQNPDAPRKVVLDHLFALINATNHQGFLLQNAAADWPVLDYNWRAYGTWGWPMNYEDSMLMHAKVESELPHGLWFLESIYSRRQKKKHLARTDELTYHLGDLSTTLDVYNGVKAQMDEGMWHVYEAQDKLVLPLVQHSLQNGIRVNHNKVAPVYEMLKEHMAHAVNLAQIYVGRGEHFNLNSDTQCKEWIYEVERYDVIKNRKTRKSTIDGDALLKLRQKFAKEENALEVLDEDEQWTPEILESRIFEGECHPLFECKAAFNWYEDKVAKYIRKQLFDKDNHKLLRVYPHISIHAQATGRHSTTAPPLAQWPDALQDLLTPDPGDMWLGGDYAAQEVWLYTALINDTATLELLQNGYDTHTLSLCDFFDFDYPPTFRAPYEAPENQAWRDKYGLHHSKNPYRAWAKAGDFSLRYLKREDQMHLIPGSRSLGVDAERGLSACQRFLGKRPALKSYRDGLAGTRPTQSRTFSGRVRKLNATGPKLLREFVNSPIQGGGADLLNYTIIRACSLAPKVIQYVYGVHDSFYFRIPLDREEELVPMIQAKLAEPYDVYGHQISFPIEWKKRYCSL